jgi:hypothetical protein
MTEIDLWSLQPGDLMMTREGSRARVKEPTQDGQWILVDYLMSDDGTAAGEDLVALDEIAAVEGVEGVTGRAEDHSPSGEYMPQEIMSLEEQQRLDARGRTEVLAQLGTPPSVHSAASSPSTNASKVSLKQTRIASTLE